MALTHNFSDMLKQVQIERLLFDEVAKNAFFFNIIKKDPTWSGGQYNFPKNVGIPSTIRINQLSAVSDIVQQQNIKPYESNLITFAHSLQYDMQSMNLNDGYRVSGKDRSYVKLIKDVIEGAANYYKEVLSRQILNGGLIAKATADGTAGGLITVKFFERFTVGQAVIVRESDTPAAVLGYITAISREGVLTIKDAVSGGSAVDLSAYTVAKGAALYLQDTVNTSTGALVSTAIMNSFRDSLLSSANGGLASLHNITKASYVQMQAANKSLSGASAQTLLEEIYKAYLDIEREGRGKPNKILISYTNFGHIAANLELNTMFKSMETKETYGFTSAKIMGPQGVVEFVVLREMDDDLIYFWDNRSAEIAGRRFFQNETQDKTGKPFYDVRATTGYTYVQDILFYGNMIWLHPSYCGVGHSISI